MTLIGNLFGQLFGDSASEFEARGDQFASVNNWRQAHGEYVRALQKTSRSSPAFRRLEAKLDEARVQSFESLIEDIHSRIDVREYTFAAEQIEAARELVANTENKERLEACVERLRGTGRYEPRPAATLVPQVPGDEPSTEPVRKRNELRTARPAARTEPKPKDANESASAAARSADLGRLLEAARVADHDPKQTFMRLLEGMPLEDKESRAALGPLYQAAALALAEGNAAGAAELLARLRTERPESRIVFYDLGDALQAAGKHDDAVNLYIQRLDLFPDEWQTWYDLAQVLWNMDEKTQAQQVIDAGIRRCPRSGHLVAQSGVFLVKSGQMREALEKFYLALQLDEFDDAGLYHTIATLHQQLGDEEKARRGYLKALELQPRSIGAQLDYAELLLNSQDGRGALAILETAFRTLRAGGAKRVYRAYASYLSSRAHLMLGEREMALLAVSRALEDNDQTWMTPALQAQRLAVLSV